MQLNFLKSKKVIIGLALIVLVMAGLYFNTNRILSEVKGKVVAKLESKLGTNIQIKSLQLSGFAKISAYDIVIKGDDGGEFIRAKELAINFGIIDLLTNYSQPLKMIKDIELNSPQINLVQQDNWNYNFLLASASQQNNQTSNELFPIYINEGTAEVKTKDFSEQLRQINGLIDLREGTGIFLDAKLKGLESKIKSKIIIDQRDYQGKINFSNLQLNNLTNKSNLSFPQDLEVAGDLTGEVKFKGKLSQPHSFYGDLFLEDGSLTYQDIQLNKINGNFGINDYGLQIKDLRADYKNNLVNLSGSIFGWENPQLNLGYQVQNLEMSIMEQFLEQEIDVSGEADLTGQVEGTIDQPTIRSEVQMRQIDIAQETIEDIEAELYYKAGVLNIEKFNSNYKQGSINLDGTLNFNQEFNYIVNTDFKDLSVADINFASLSELNLQGGASGQAIISGTGLSREELSVLGSLEMMEGAIKGYEFGQFNSRFWLNKEKLFLNNTKLQGPTSEGTINGVIALDGSLDLDLKLNKLPLAELEEFHKVKELTGQIDVIGDLEGTLSSPQLEGEVNGASLQYQNISIGTVSSKLSFKDQQLQFKEAVIPDYASKLTGKIDFAEQNSNLEIITNNLAAQKVDSIIHEDLTLTGSLTAETKISSILSTPQIESSLRITNGALLEKQNFDQIQSTLAYDLQQQKLNIKQGSIKYKDSSLQLDGSLNGQELDFNFKSDKVVWGDINFTDKLEELTGSAEVSGSIYGNLENPKAAAKLSARDLQFAEKTIGDVSGRVDYRNHNIYLTDIDVKDADNEYRLNGSLNWQQRKLNQVSVEITTATSNYLAQFMPYDGDVSYQFNGQLEVRGDIKEPQFDVELVVQDNDEAGSLEVTGDYLWRENADLKLVATKFGIDVINQFDLLPYNVSGDLNLNGNLTGPLTAPNFKSDLKITAGAIANLNYEKIAGELEVIEGRKVIVDQELQGEGKNVVQAVGQIPLKDEEEFDFNLNLAEGNLRILSLLIPEIKSANGKGSADLKITGPLAKPRLTGTAKVVAGSFSHPALDEKISNFNGELKFANEELVFKNIEGYYGEGSFSGGGSITLDGLLPAQYNLQLQGEEIVFDHGSWNGLNDLDVSITGSGLEPQIEGQIRAYDTQFELPVNWPSAQGGGLAEVNPQLDLTVEPGRNVRVVNEQIDILVQRGSLNLRTIDGQVRIIGELSSNSGRFTYYNTEFELQKGRAIFRQYDYIPNLQLEATTEIYDRTAAKNDNSFSGPYHDITLNLNGPADQLNYQLSSDSDLSQEQMIALLTGQGGIGNLLEKNYEQALTAELRRVIGEGIKTEVIYKVERSFERSLDLDEVRIKSLLENDDNIEVELGKYIFNNFMLKYYHSFLEENKAIGFEYYFNQGLDNLMIQGNYDSEGDYELGLEASIPFE